jgi:hypothetical protein
MLGTREAINSAMDPMLFSGVEGRISAERHYPSPEILVHGVTEFLFLFIVSIHLQSANTSDLISLNITGIM